MVYHKTRLQPHMRWNEHLIEMLIVLDRLWIPQKALEANFSPALYRPYQSYNTCLLQDGGQWPAGLPVELEAPQIRT